jgi:porin
VAFILLITILWADFGIAQNDDSAPSGWISADRVTGNWFRQRKALVNYGAEVFGSYTAEVWGNVTGGLKQGGLYIGLLTFGLNLDLEKAVGWNGASAV